MTELTRHLAVQCRGLAKTYGSGDTSVMALRGVDLGVYCGELLMLVGPSGCGKTTLISIIAAMLEQDGGSCRVLDREVSGWTRARGRAFGALRSASCSRASTCCRRLPQPRRPWRPLVVHRDRSEPA